MASFSRKLEVYFVGDTKSLERAYDRAGKKSSAFGKTFGKFGKAGAVGAAAGGVYLLGKQLSSATKAALEAEKAQTRLTGAFESAGVGQKQYAAAQARISKVSKQAALDDEDLSDSLAKLTRTSGSAAKGMKGMELAANIARARNISLEAATKIVEKAMVGQLRGMKGVGVQIDKNTSTTEALERAQKKFAGSAEAYGKTAAGAQDKLSVAFENLQERVGAKLLPVLTKLSLKLVDLIDWSERNWPKFAAAVQNAYTRFKPVIDNMIARIKDIAKIFEGVVMIVRGIANGEWSMVWTGMKKVVVGQISLMYHAFLELPKKIAVALGKKAWNGILAGLRAVLNQAIDMINNVIGKANKVGSLIGKIPGVGDGPKIPTIGKVGATTQKAGSGLRTGAPAAGGRPDEGTRGLSSRGTTQTVNLVVDGQVLARTIIPRIQRTANTQATPRRGRYGGANLGTG